MPPLYSLNRHQSRIPPNLFPGISRAGISSDQFESVLRGIHGDAGIGVKSYHANRAALLNDVLSTGLLEAMADEANRRSDWNDVLIERIRSGRGGLR